MVGLGSTGLIKMRLIRSKIRKREDSSAVVSAHHHHSHQNNNNNNNNNNQQQQQQFHQNLTQVVHQNQNQSNGKAVNGVGEQPQQQQNQSVWVFPPLPPQPNIYSVNQLALMQANQDQKNGFKGLKRQLSGRFKRLISRKPNEPPTPTIPPELKPQLKTIFVY